MITVDSLLILLVSSKSGDFQDQEGYKFGRRPWRRDVGIPKPQNDGPIEAEAEPKPSALVATIHFPYLSSYPDIVGRGHPQSNSEFSKLFLCPQRPQHAGGSG